jgi:hypothetical protein
LRARAAGALYNAADQTFVVVIYVEYISRRPGIELNDFHRVVRQVQQNWQSGSPQEHLILNAGRTWRLGPDPEYLGVWHVPSAGLERLGQWEQAFRDRGVVGDEATMTRVARVDFAGCYEELADPIPARNSLYYVEQFRPAGPAERIGQFYAGRAKSLPQFSLNLLCVRIGRLAPDPGGLAVWTVPGYASLDQLARHLDGLTQPVELITAGLYRDIGQEIL